MFIKHEKNQILIDNLSSLLQTLDLVEQNSCEVIHWGSPVPVFGNIFESHIATVGINPSNKEFYNNNGKRLEKSLSRFHTLDSLGLDKWENAKAKHLELILNSCINYFHNNPYNLWFKALEDIIQTLNYSYYTLNNQACHLDLIPFATEKKWGELKKSYKDYLIEKSNNSLAVFIKESHIKLLILNGKSVVNLFSKIARIKLVEQRQKLWDLKRNSGRNIAGYSYCGHISNISGIDIGRTIKILGFNHNLQSSYGITKDVKNAIRSWIRKKLIDKQFVHE